MVGSEENYKFDLRVKGLNKAMIPAGELKFKQLQKRSQKNIQASTRFKLVPQR